VLVRLTLTDEDRTCVLDVLERGVDADALDWTRYPAVEDVAS
jgi:hypothetical protein